MQRLTIDIPDDAKVLEREHDVAIKMRDTASRDAWLASLDPAERQRIAKLNPGADWASELAKRDALIAKSAPAETVDPVEDAYARYEQLRKASGLSYSAFAATDEGAAAGAEYDEARMQALLGSADVKKAAIGAVSKAWSAIETAHEASGKPFVEWSTSPEAASLIEAYDRARAGAL